MRTFFTPEQLCDPHLAEAEKNLRACVHCGICTATCPTYVLLGDERDGPRGRIVMMQKMLEAGGAPSSETVLHVDRCLSCMGCRTACPSGVDYARLVDTARVHIETHYRRPWRERMLRWLIANVLTRPALVRSGVALARLFAPIAQRLPGTAGAMARMATKASSAPISPVAANPGGRRIALMAGCVQPALAPSIDAAIARTLTRRGFDIVPLVGAGCCGALAHHLGKDATAQARRVIAAFEATGEVEAVLIGATGCSAHLADYPHLFGGDPVWGPRAAAFAAKAKDYSALAEPRSAGGARLRVAWQAPCSMQNSLHMADRGAALLEAAGYEVLEIPETHLCCGSAGSYSLLQPGIAAQLRTRKLGHIASVRPDIIATANIGCLNHLSGPDAPPVVHLAELIDWAEGGPRPVALPPSP